ncbi:MAG: hypothetical protein JWN62_735 [Acidimicrobiales bacterium]|nr:hypothetical protein [Acidimicrobiales bacterium]
MNDVLDDRLRALMVRVEEMAPPAPEFDSLRSRSVFVSGTRRSTTRMLVAVAATLVLVIAGLIVIQSRHDDVSLTSQRRLTIHSVATVLPDGWEAKGAVDGKPDRYSGGVDELTLYANALAPLGPVLGLLSSWAGTHADSTTQTNVVLGDGRRAALGTTHEAGARSLDVEAAPNQWVGVIARGISDVDLLAIGTQVQVDASGSASLSGVVPLGLVAAGTTTDYSVVQIGLDTDVTQIRLGVSVTGYGPVGSDSAVTVTAFAPTPADRAQLGLVGDVASMSAIGAPGATTYAVDFGDHAGVGVYRERDGVAFLARSSSRDVSQLADLLDSLEPVDDATWGRLVALRADNANSSTQDTTVVTTAPPPATVAPGATTPTPVEVDYAITSVDDGYDAVAEIPAGTVTMHLRLIGRATLVDMSLNGELIASESVDSTSGGSWSSPRNPTGGSGYLDIVPSDDPAAELRITDQDHVYSTKFITLDPANAVRIAMILVPPLEGRTAPTSGYTYAEDGTPLDSFN